MIKNKTYFVDIDGTIIKYRAFSDLKTIKPVPVQDVIDFLNKEKTINGAYIVITSARPKVLEAHTKKELKQVGIKYDALLLGVGRGARIVVNDIPQGSTEKKALGLNLIRNKGLKGAKY